MSRFNRSNYISFVCIGKRLDFCFPTRLVLPDIMTKTSDSLLFIPLSLTIGLHLVSRLRKFLTYKKSGQGIILDIQGIWPPQGGFRHQFILMHSYFLVLKVVSMVVEYTCVVRRSRWTYRFRLMSGLGGNMSWKSGPPRWEDVLRVIGILAWFKPKV